VNVKKIAKLIRSLVIYGDKNGQATFAVQLWPKSAVGMYDIKY
jgi:hypothetical protein